MTTFQIFLKSFFHNFEQVFPIHEREELGTRLQHELVALHTSLIGAFGC